MCSASLTFMVRDGACGRGLRYGEIQCPVGVLYGEKDTILKPSEHINAVTDAIDAAEYQILPNAGHMIPVTQVQACADFICAIDAKAR